MNTKYLNIRLTDEQYEQLEILKGKLQEKLGKSVKVTTKIVFLEAMNQLTAYYDKLDRDKKRDR